MAERPRIPQRPATTLGQNAVGPADVGVAPPDQARVAAFGDSLMWGQGLNRTDRFTALIARALPEILGRQEGIVAWDQSRSGAQIRDRIPRVFDHRTQFPIQVFVDQHTQFLDTFPSLFHGRRQEQRFIQGTDESPATGLYGEIPAPFPTVHGQVDLMPDALGETIDVALVDGGVNDIGVEDIINPDVSSGEFVERWDGQIRAVGHDDVLRLLGHVRRKCPNAVIMYFGFYAPFSYESSRSKIRDFLQHEYDDDIAWWFNSLSLIRLRNVNAMVQEAMTRSVWMQGRWHYWTRQAVVDANKTATVRGPGVLFVPSGFTAENSGFATSPFLNEDYTHPTTDPAQHERVSRCPRAPQLDAMRALYSMLPPGTAANRTPGEMPRWIRDMLNSIDGPLTLRQALMDSLDPPFPSHFVRDRVGELLSAEIGRIQHALIASLGHPNAAGAKSYADNAIARLTGHLAVTRSINLDMRPEAPPAIPAMGETLDAKLRRYRLRGTGSLHADAGHLDVDSLAVRTVTAADSDQNFFPDVWLIITTRDANDRLDMRHMRMYQLNFNYRRIRSGASERIQWWVVKLYPHRRQVKN